VVLRQQGAADRQPARGLVGRRASVPTASASCGRRSSRSILQECQLMSRLRLTIMTGDYDRIHPLRDGQVRIEGCDVNYLCMSPEEGFYRAFTNQEFDVTELSFSSYIIARSRGVANYIGLPVFLSRMFRHSAIYIHKDSGIARPQDLKGRKVGVPVYAITESLWVVVMFG
jgi:4,5-dihydroxyphthalate decarboxylase